MSGESVYEKALNTKDWWRRFLDLWNDIGYSAHADLRTDSGYVAELTVKENDPPIPEDILSGKIAHQHIFGRTDLGDYRNKIKNVYGNPVGITVHVKRSFGQNILTIEDIAGECPLINIVTASGKKITLSVGKIPVTTGGCIESTKVEF